MFASSTKNQPTMNHINNFFRIGRLSLIAAAVSVSLNSCETEEPTPPSTSGGTPTPQINDGHGTLVAAKTITVINQPFIGEIEVEYGIGVAVFFNGTDYNTFIDGGTVKCEDETLSRFENGTYSTYSQTSATGIDFSGNANWEVSGAGVIPSFTHTANRGFPGISAISSPETVTRANGYTVTFDGAMTNTDSVIWVVGSKQFSTTGPLNSRTFTADELSDLTTGAGNIIQVAAYNIDSEVYGGKTFYFINEMVVTKTVTVE
jgi:hypothetical protein